LPAEAKLGAPEPAVRPANVAPQRPGSALRKREMSFTHPNEAFSRIARAPGRRELVRKGGGLRNERLAASKMP
jgi:hypothetical protein